VQSGAVVLNEAKRLPSAPKTKYLRFQTPKGEALQQLLDSSINSVSREQICTWRMPSIFLVLLEKSGAVLVRGGAVDRVNSRRWTFSHRRRDEMTDQTIEKQVIGLGLVSR
jgi:hypothetical protein